MGPLEILIMRLDIINHPPDKPPGMTKVRAVFFLLLFALSTGAFARNTAWQNEISLGMDLVEKSPGKVRPYIALASAFYKSKRVDEAIASYSAAIALNPASAEAHYGLGLAYAAQHMFGKAEEQCLAAIKLDPRSVKAHFNYGVICLSPAMFDLRRAAAEFESVLLLDPSNLQARQFLAYISKQR